MAQDDSLARLPFDVVHDVLRQHFEQSSSLQDFASLSELNGLWGDVPHSFRQFEWSEKTLFVKSLERGRVLKRKVEDSMIAEVPLIHEATVSYDEEDEKLEAIAPRIVHTLTFPNFNDIFFTVLDKIPATLRKVNLNWLFADYTDRALDFMEVEKRTKAEKERKAIVEFVTRQLQSAYLRELLISCKLDLSKTLRSSLLDFIERPSFGELNMKQAPSSFVEEVVTRWRARRTFPLKEHIKRTAFPPCVRFELEDIDREPELLVKYRFGPLEVVPYPEDWKSPPDDVYSRVYKSWEVHPEVEGQMIKMEIDVTDERYHFVLIEFCGEECGSFDF